MKGSGHDPRNVQVVLEEAETGFNISLQDSDGDFLTVEPTALDLMEHKETSDGRADDEDNVDAGDVIELRDAFH